MPSPVVPTASQRPTREEYDRWLRRSFRSREVRRGRVDYEPVALVIRDRFEQSEFWREALTRMDAWKAEYNVAEGEVLLGEPPRGLLLKSWESFTDKTYRRNVAVNANWPDPPDDGWVTPPAAYAQITDIVRTLFVARYVDGVRFLTNQFVSLANELDLEADVDLQAKPEGYYAAHLIVRIPMELPLADLSVNPVAVGVEIQVTTQMQELIRKLLHRQYERERMAPADDSWRWQWESPKFSLGYLGHIIHYVEGRMVNLRDAGPESEEDADAIP